MIRSTLLLCFTLFAGHACADIFEWVDKDGKKHYSDQSPPHDAKQSVTVRKYRSTANAAPTAAAPGISAAPDKQKSYTEMEADFKKRRVEKEEAEAKQRKELAEAAEKQKNCERARNHAKNLQNGGRFTKTGPDGEQIYLEDKEIDAAKDEASKQLEQWCKG